MVSRAFRLSLHRRGRVLAALFAFWTLLGSPALLRSVTAAPGDLDPHFGIGGKVSTDLGDTMGSGNNQAFALAIQHDGRIVVAGRRGSAFVSGQVFPGLDFALVRYNADGTLDGSFGNGGKVITDFDGHTDDTVFALVLQPDNKIVAVGRAGGFGIGFGLARYNADGLLDTSFGNGGMVTTFFSGGGMFELSEALAGARQPDGKIVAAGYTNLSGKEAFALARYNTDGSLDTGFGTTGRTTTDSFTGRGARALGVAVQADGAIVAGGFADFSGTSGPSVSKLALARFNPDGSLDGGFGSGGKVIGGNGLGKALAVQPDGKILLAGVTGSDIVVERYTSDGTPDATFGIGGRVTTDFKCPPCASEEGAALVLQPNGKILVAGWSSVANDRDFAIVRYNPDGSLDVTFGNGGKVLTNFGADEMASGLALQDDGNIVAAGSRCNPNCLSGKSVFALARYEGGPPTLAAAVLPGSRSVQVGGTATAFATIIAVGGGVARGCTITPATLVPGTFLYQATDPGTNVPTGSPNTAADVASGTLQTFVFAVTPTAPLAPTDVHLTFDCANTDPAGIIPGVNTLLLSASTSPVPDIVALAATLANDGIVNIPGATDTGVFAVATVNVGFGGGITASADTTSESLSLGSAVSGNLPVSILLCQTNSTTGECLFPPSTTVTTQIDSGATPTFGVFVRGSGLVPFDPASNRIFVRFKDAGGITRGATSVAVRTQ